MIKTSTNVLHAAIVSLLLVSAAFAQASRLEQLRPNRDAELAAVRYAKSLQSFHWTNAAALMHPDALAELKSLIAPLVERQPTAVGQRLFQTKTLTEFESLEGAEVFERLMQSLVEKNPRKANQSILSLDARLVGSVPEGNDLVHVLFRIYRTPVAASPVGDVDMRTVKRDGTAWRVMLPRGLRSVIEEWKSTVTGSLEDALRSDICGAQAPLDFAIPKWKDDKSFQIEDAYKWLYQATRGGEHAAPDVQSARDWLDSEWKTLGRPLTDEPVWEPLCPGGEIGRLNLRPFKSGGGKSIDLLRAFLDSSSEYRTDGTAFVESWNELGTRLKKHAVGRLTYRSWSTLDNQMKPQNYPAIHHSPSYEAANRPAYRVLTRAQMEKLLRHGW